MTQRRFNSLPEAKRYIYECLAETLELDLDQGSEFIFDNEFSERDQARVVKACEQVIAELDRKAQPRRRGR